MEWLLSDTHRRMRWKNGRGETIEIAVEPRGATLETFQWRVSTAAVVEDGVFSTFEGIDRTLAVLGGGTLVLSIHNGSEQALNPTSAPLSFAADAPCRARLIGAAVTDLNVMSRRGVCRHSLQRLVPGIACEQASHEAVVVAAPEAAVVQIDGSRLELRPLDALRLPSGHTVVLLSGDAWLAQFDPVST